MLFPIDDSYWIQARDTLKQYAQPLDAVLAPNEFMEFFPGNYHYNVTYHLSPEHFQFVLFHKGMVNEIEPPFALEVQQTFKPIWGNSVFVLYAKNPPSPLPEVAGDYLQPLLDQLSAIAAQQKSKVKSPKYAITITTHNRPESLARSLPQILSLGAPVVVVDDASSPENYEQNRRITDEHQVPLIRIPENRGLPNAMNVGITYWLADPDIDWISYFQDDVDVHPDLLRILEQVQDAKERPILAGRDALEHPTLATGAIAGYEVIYKRSMPGQHLHAHRDYWASVLPIPTPYLGAPKPNKGKPGQGADEDWWITAWSPHSITKRGGYVVCVPGLVRSFQGGDMSGSTWGNVSDRAADGRPMVGAQLLELAVPKTDPDKPELEPVQPVTEPKLAPDLIGTLSGVKILVDGYNLQLATGTGIKTYGTTLIRSLQHMGANVDVLLSRNSNKKDPVLDEVLFFDENTQRPNQIARAIGLVKGFLKSSSGPLYKAWRRESMGQVVLKQGKFTEDFIKYAQSFNLPKCYEQADANFSLFNKITNIYLPEKMDIWHATIPMPIRIKGTKMITTVHDLIPLRLPYTTLDNKKDFYGKVRYALKESALVIAVSEHTKKDLLTYFDADPDRIFVTYQPVTLKPLQASPADITEYLQRYKLEYQNYLLFVGAIEPKKNLGRLLEAYATLDTDLPLVIVGKKAWSWEEELSKMSYLFANDSRRQVKFLEYVPLESLRYLYSGAYCFLFPSLYEGFGLPPLEAMTMGCPVITSNASCLPEVCGPAALYVNPYDSTDIRQKMEQMLGDRPLRDQLAKAAQQNAAQYSTENYLHRLHQAYLRVLS